MRKLEGTRPVRPVSVATIIHASDSYCRVTCAFPLHRSCHTHGYTSRCPSTKSNAFENQGLSAQKAGHRPNRGGCSISRQADSKTHTKKVPLEASKLSGCLYGGCHLAALVPTCMLLPGAASYLISVGTLGSLGCTELQARFTIGSD